MTDYLKKNKVNIFLLLMIAGLVSIPLMADSLLTGTNLQASLSRIEAMGEGLGKAFPIRVVPLTTADYGYAATGFEADLFLVIPALFLRLGMEIELAYKLFLVLINIATAVISYGCFYRMFGRKTIGIMGSMLYTWCPYRCSDLYVNANVGESVAWAFVPIVLLGMIRLYSASWEKTEEGSIWVTFTLGFTLLALSSVAFFCVAVGATIILFLLMGKRSFCRRNLICVGKTMLSTLLLTMWFLVPMLLRMREPAVVGSRIPENFRMGGLYLAQYLSIFPSTGDGLNFAENGAKGAQEMGIGAAVILLVVIYLWCLFVKKIEDDFGKKILILVGVLLLLGSNWFPWDLLQNKNMLFSIVLALLQSPAKWAVVAYAGLIWIACRMLQKLAEGGEEKIYQSVLAVTALAAFGMNQLLSGELLRNREGVYLDVEDWGRIPMQILAQESGFWRLCEVISVVTLCVLLGMWIVRRRKSVKR